MECDRTPSKTVDKSVLLERYGPQTLVLGARVLMSVCCESEMSYMRDELLWALRSDDNAQKTTGRK